MRGQKSSRLTLHNMQQQPAAEYETYSSGKTMTSSHAPPHSLRLPSGERRIDSKKKKKKSSHASSLSGVLLELETVPASYVTSSQASTSESGTTTYIYSQRRRGVLSVFDITGWQPPVGIPISLYI